MAAVAFAAVAEEPVPQPVPEGKAAEYYRILAGRPRPGYLFDRFCDSWLEQNDLSQLESFLSASDEPSARRLLAFLYERMREPEKAAAIYDELMASAPDDMELLFYKASVDADRAGFSDAADGLGKLLENEAVTGDLRMKALKLQGRCLLRDGHRSEGLAAWQTLLEVSEMDDDVDDELLDLQLSEGLYKEALENCERMLEDTKDAYRKVMLRMRRASLLVRMDRRSEAIDGLCKAFGSAGQGGWLQRDLLDRIELLYRGADDLAGLCTCCERMLEAWPESPVLHRAHAEALLACGRDNEALEAARALVKLVPDSQEIKEWYVDLLLGLRHNDEALAMVEGFLERFPDDNALRLRLADICKRNADTDAAVKWIMEYLAHSAKTEADYLQTARTLARYELNDEATAVFLGMLEQWPDSAEGREAVAMHLSRKSYLQLNLAWKHYEWLARSCDLETLLRLESALMAASSPDRAIALLELREADFSPDFRFASARFDAIAASKQRDGLLDAGMRRLDLAQTVEEMDTASTALVYELKKQKIVSEWIERFEAEADRPTAHCWLLALLYITAHQPEQADALLRAALERNPADPDLLQCRLKLARRQHDWAVAETVLVEMIGQDPSRQAAWIRELVPVLLGADKHDAALEWIETWKKTSPNAIRPYELERDTLVAAGQPDEAIQRMRRATLRFAESKELKLALGHLYESTGRAIDAEDLYWRLLNAEETLDGRMAMLGNIIRIKQASNGMDALILELQRRSESARTSPFPLLGLAECYRINHRIADRSEVLERVLELRPDDLAVLRAKADLAEELGNYDAARSLMLRIADKDSTGTAYRKLVEFEFLYGDPAVAASMLADPRVVADPDSFLDLAATLLAKGCASALEGPLEKQQAGAPQDYRFAFLQGVLLKEQGDTAAACRIFSALLQRQEERPGVVTKPENPVPPQSFSSMSYSSLSRYSRQLGQWQLEYGASIPQELIAMYSQAAYSASYSRIRSGVYGGSPGAPRLEVPQDLDELKLLSSRQLLQSGGELSSGTRASVEADAPYIGMLWIDDSLQVNTTPWWQALEALYPDDEAIPLFRMLVGSQSIESEEELIASIERFSAEYPELTLQLLVRAGGRSAALLERLPGLMDSIGVDEDNVASVMQLTMQALGSLASTNAAYPRLVHLFETVEEQCREKTDLDEFLQLQLKVARARLDNDFSGVFSFIEEKFEAPDARYKPGVSRSSSGSGSYVIRYYALERFNFPPQQLPDSNGRSFQMFVNNLGLDRKLLCDALIDWGSPDSLFRWLALAQLGAEPSVLQQAAEAVAARPEKTRNELFALVCWHADREELEQALYDALELRTKAGSDPVMRSTFDRGLLSLLSRMETIPESIRPQLTGLVGPFRKTLWQDRQARIQIVDLMEQLDLPLDDVVQAAAQSKPSGGAGSSSRSNPPNVAQEIREQLERGETDAALLRVAVMLRTEALRSIYGNARQQPGYDNSLRNGLQYIRQRRQVDALLALMAPPENGRSPRRLYEYAYALDNLNRSRDAFEIYRQVYEARPDWMGAKVRYCIGLTGEDPAAAQAILESLPPDQVESVLAGLQQGWNNRDLRYEDRLAIVEMVIMLVEDGNASRSSSGGHYLQNLVSWLSNQWYENQQEGSQRQQLPGLFDESEAGSLAPGWELPRDQLSGRTAYWEDEKLVALQQHRRESYIRLLKAMCINSTWFGSDAFEKLTGYCDYTQATLDDAELFGLARAAIANTISNNRYRNSGLKGKARPALEFYVTELSRRNDWSDAVALLKSGMSGSMLRSSLGNLVELQAAESDADYLLRLETMMNDPARLQMGEKSWVELACRQFRMAGRDGDLAAMIWRVVDRKMEQRNWNECAALVSAWVQSEVESGQPVDLCAIYGRFMDGVFTDEDRAIIQAAPAGSLNYTSHQSIYRKCQQLSSAFNGLELPPEAILAVLELTAPIDEKLQNVLIQQNLLNRTYNQLLDVDWSSRMGLLADWDEFPFQLLLGGQQSYFWRAVNQLQGRNGTAMMEAINALEQPTFGATLLKVLLENPSWDKRPVAVFTGLAPYRERLEADPERSGRLFSWMQETLFTGRPVPEAAAFADADKAVLLKPYDDWRRRIAIDTLAELESLKLSSMMQNQHNVLLKAGPAIQELMVSDPARAQSVSDRLIRMLKVATSLNGQALTDSNILYQLFNNRTYSEAECRFAVVTAIRMKSEDALRWFSETYASESFSRAVQRGNAAGLESNAAQLQAARECIGMLMPLGDEVPVTVYLRWIERINSSLHGDVKVWLDQQGFPESNNLAMLRILLDPTVAEASQLERYFSSAGVPGHDRLTVFIWMMNHAYGSKLDALTRPELGLGLLDLFEAETSIRLPITTYQGLLDYADQLDAGSRRDALIDRLFGLWTHLKVDGAPLNTGALERLVRLATALGRIDDAESFLNHSELLQTCSTYPLALRYGLYDWVAKQLPLHVLNLDNRNLAQTDMWIPAEAAARCESLVQQLDDEALRPLVKFFFAQLPVKKDGQCAVDEQRVEDALALMAEAKDQAGLFRWTLNHSALDWGQDAVRKLRDQYMAQVDIVGLLRQTPSPKAECDACIAFLQEKGANNDYALLGEWLRSIARTPEGSIILGNNNSVCWKALLKVMLRQAMQSQIPELRSLALDAYRHVRIEGQKKESFTPSKLFRQLGMYVFDPASMGLDYEDPVERMLAYDAFDREKKGLINDQTATHVSALKNSGMQYEDAAQQARKDLMEQWIAEAGEQGFLPLWHVLTQESSWFGNLDYDAIDDLRDLLAVGGDDSLMRSQLLAALGMVDLRRSNGEKWEPALADIKHYFARRDLDMVEKVRVLQDLNRQGWYNSQIKLELAEETAAASAFADAFLKWLNSESTRNTSDHDRNIYNERLIPLLFAVGHRTEAVELLGSGKVDVDALPAMFLTALDYGEKTWCSTNLSIPVLSHARLRRTHAAVGNPQALAGAIAACDNADLRLAADIFFCALTRGAADRSQELKRLADEFTFHEFRNYLCELQSRSILEKSNLLEPIEISPHAINWVEATGVESLIHDWNHVYSLERLVFKEYVNSLLDSGKIGKVCAVYDNLRQYEFEQDTSQWLVTLPFEGGRLPGSGNSGADESGVSNRYRDMDLKQWYNLAVLSDQICKKNQSNYRGSRATEAVNVSCCILSGQPERLYELQYNDINPDTFHLFSALSGIYADGVDDALLTETLKRYIAGVNFYKMQKRPSGIERLKWEDVAKWILHTYPYNKDVEKWLPFVQELIPKQLDVETLQLGKSRK